MYKQKCNKPLKDNFRRFYVCHFSEAKIVNIDGMQFSEFRMNKLN